MDYEKAYKASLETAMQWIKDGCSFGEQICLETIFPQLRESKDERIRKGLIEALKTSKTVGELKFVFPEPTREEAIAYLEKQKEQKPKHFDLKAGKWYICHRAFCCRADHLTVKEGERFQCEKDGIVKGFVIKEPEKYFKECSAPEPMEDEQKEQKPVEWSEEDENMLNRIIETLSLPPIYDTKACAKMVSWLKSLRPQPKQEWSEDWQEEDIQTRFAFYTYKDDPSVLYLSNVFVEELSRNHGFGTRILRAAEKVAETIGATTICLKVKQDSPANAWYRKNGYGYVAFEDGYDWLEKNLEYMKPIKQERSEKHIADVFEKVGLAKIVREQGNDALTNAVQSALIELSKAGKAEWSEEDEKMLKCCLIAINHYEKTCNIGDHRPTKFNIDGYLAYVDKVKSWLKSLRPSWKPSEEQMKAFKGYIEDFQARAEAAVGGWNNFDVMIRLYEQLKKLM